jgi:hypothetical protein
MRAPERLLPALGVYYLFFGLVAAPILPFGPAIAWWVLCASVLLGAMVAARHVSGDEVPEGQRRHQQVVGRLEDHALAATSLDVEAFLATGAGAEILEARIGAARERALPPDALMALARDAARGQPIQRAHRERALRQLLEA